MQQKMHFSYLKWKVHESYGYIVVDVSYISNKHLLMQTIIYRYTQFSDTKHDL